MKAITIRGEGVVLDALLHAEFGAEGARRLLAETLALNPGIAALGPVLPVGTVVTLPEAPAPRTSAPARKVVSLFG